MVGPAFSDLETFAEVQRVAGIRGPVLVAIVYVQRGEGIGAVAEANDVLLGTTEDHDHFVGAVASLPIDEPGEEVATEFERCLDAGFVGGVIEILVDDLTSLADGDGCWRRNAGTCSG